MTDVLWTEENIARLKDLFFKGKSMAEISALMPGSTRNGVIGKLHRLNLRNEQRTVTKKKPHKKKPHKPKPIVQRPEQTSPTDGFSFTDLEHGMCLWSVSSGFCGAPVVGVRKPYCAEHAQKAKRRD
jgi:hypothetical protein